MVDMETVAGVSLACEQILLSAGGTLSLANDGDDHEQGANRGGG